MRRSGAVSITTSQSQRTRAQPGSTYKNEDPPYPSVGALRMLHIAAAALHAAWFALAVACLTDTVISTPVWFQRITYATGSDPGMLHDSGYGSPIWSANAIEPEPIPSDPQGSSNAPRERPHSRFTTCACSWLSSASLPSSMCFMRASSALVLMETCGAGSSTGRRYVNIRTSIGPNDTD